MSFEPITEQQKQDLQGAGFYVEDMGSKWGKNWNDMFRWMHKDYENEFGIEQYSEADAWADAHQYYERVKADFGGLDGIPR